MCVEAWFSQIWSHNYYGHPVQDILPAHHRSFTQEWQRKTQEAEEQAYHTLKSEAFYNTHAHPLPDIEVGTNVAVQNHQSKLWDIYVVVTHVGPHRRYYVKTSSGRVLVRNRRFLRRRVQMSIPSGTEQSESLTTSTCNPPNL